VVARAHFPRAEVWKRVSLAFILALFVSACGSSSPKPPTATKLVRGPGFTFAAPASWRVRHSAASASAESSRKGQASVSASVSRLENAYTPDGFDEATKELDGVAAMLAAQLGGRVTDGKTSTVGGMRIREYSLTARDAHGHRVDDRLGFVLSGKREVELLCQAPAASRDPDGACALLFGTFRLTT
jgi:hypothetical protein